MTALVLPGRPESAAAAREFAVKALEGYPAAGDAVAALNELVTNAIQHSRSGLPGGVVEVGLTVSGWIGPRRGPRRRPARRHRPSPRATASPSAAAAWSIVEALTAMWGSAGPGLWWFWLPLGGDPE